MWWLSGSIRHDGRFVLPVLASDANNQGVDRPVMLSRGVTRWGWD